MGLEAGTHIQDLNSAWPLGSDLESTADDHLRLIKSVLKTDLVNFNGTYNSATAPVFASPSDTNTGLYFPSADTIGFATGGTQRATINSAGTVTINAPTAATALAITAASGAAASTMTGAGSDAVRLGMTDGQAGTRSWQLRVGGSAVGAFDVFDSTAAVSKLSITGGAGGLVQVADSAGTLQNAGFLNIPINFQSSNYTAVLSDAGKAITSNTVSAVTYTIPSNASVAYPLGTVLTFATLAGAGTVTIAINSDTLTLAGTTSTGSRTLSGNSGLATAVKNNTTTWVISGSGLS
jgi:hypothetical protein